ncbi:MAG: tetratricopeptide repeat protein [Myxococcales bacterium]|nr:tetratricopeptide repeat protein [Myxococcales bacterium]MBK7197669.1 tetratricopeptide repeat protein [Myxococcales bacterium]MBP6845870.1 tetratricopeptide repeat protein [Kofleriaceae bacterium]
MRRSLALATIVTLLPLAALGCGGARPAAPTTPPPAADAPAGGAPPIATIGDKAEHVCQSEDDAAVAHFNRGVDRFDQGDAAAAIDAYKAAIAIDADYCDAIDNLALIYRREGRLDEAIALYERSLAIAPHNQFAWQNVGVAYRMRGRHADAMRAYRQLAALSPANPEGWFGVAQMALMAHQAAEARDAARRAEALYVAAGSPLVDDARLLLGFAAIALADWPTVRATLEPQYAKLASDAEVNLALGKAYLEPDALDRAKARQYLQRARDLGATVTDALWQRAR